MIDTVQLKIDKNEWVLFVPDGASVAGKARLYSSPSNWAIGPIEVARILERLGVHVEITVERG